MNDDRDLILNRVKSALAPLQQRAPLPEYAGDLAVMRALIAGNDPFEVFRERIARVNGSAVTDAAEVVAQLRSGGWLHGYCDPALWPQLAPHFPADFTVETSFEAARIDDYAFGITRAEGAIAETGTIILKDASTSSRLAALAPWVHIAVVRRGDILGDLSQAVAALGDDPNIIWCTGSSSTADVEGILIRGVHGPGVQIALVVG
jgi:L-lactate dehydrogenase complex protein LldG